MRWLLAIVCLSFSLLSHASATPTLEGAFIDKVLVVKSERQLYLLSRGVPLKSYRVSLGKQPGPKQREGDQRTPEGLYWIDWRKTSDKFNLAMHISYPNARDLARARSEGISSPGSMIMLHGTPLDEEYPEWFFHTLDWTEGCIALKNDDMREVWNLVKDGTLIEIRP
ncbi:MULTISPECIES: L,D-transpeptidase family protein [Pseudomonadaceae]|jgi:murein L,D-transpeptidase YafK|uniref:ErfK/YbiS/YcfS/YnhG n=1 Tax=Pseudomonas saudiphocaensis TaxID=1499686 RepID=A0A078M1J2_9PSED|nr:MULTISPECIES: L,D-transpeptidase family protein [Pseudomonadaceae]MCF6782201.1 L,D-transpeptidase family protein [Stutzerimonas stutzeri]MCF6805479.1 L,D-transpeptidase family protein [Stutzerimonas stutzeri]RRV14617.1 hypothetical protein EGJ00_13355 [Pseudomonas saudiphocaensis]CDZ95921.1 ErfK/YbiS/YcfS/YnhG [Pseudomonas saudiphocaensis]